MEHDEIRGNRSHEEFSILRLRQSVSNLQSELNRTSNENETMHQTTNRLELELTQEKNKRISDLSELQKGILLSNKIFGIIYNCNIYCNIYLYNFR